MGRARFLERKPILELIGDLYYKIQLICEAIKCLEELRESLEEEVEQINKAIEEIQERIDKHLDSFGSFEARILERIEELEHKVAYLELMSSRWS